MIETRRDGNHLIVRILGRFDFDLYREFRKLFAVDAKQRGQLTIDMTHVSYMDSSALGMLLLLEQRLGETYGRIRLTGAHGQPRDVLEIAHFDQHFDIG
jgi:anti-anti-sigma factor